MATREQALGNWNQLKGKVKEHWGELTDRELDEVKGNIDQLIGLVQRKTGEARSQIEGYLDQLSDEAGGVFTQASEKAREYANQAADAMRGSAEQVRERAREGYEQVRERAVEGYEQAQTMVRRHPAEAVAVAFGTGLLMGLVVGLAARSR
jgi:uncharacterized protein YjbJ (UPF0337 family)